MSSKSVAPAPPALKAVPTPPECPPALPVIHLDEWDDLYRGVHLLHLALTGLETFGDGCTIFADQHVRPLVRQSMDLLHHLEILAEKLYKEPYAMVPMPPAPER